MHIELWEAIYDFLANMGAENCTLSYLNPYEQASIFLQFDAQKLATFATCIQKARKILLKQYPIAGKGIIQKMRNQTAYIQAEISHNVVMVKVAIKDNLLKAYRKAYKEGKPIAFAAKATWKNNQYQIKLS